MTCVTFGRFSTFGAASWVLLSPVGPDKPRLWSVLHKYGTTFPSEFTADRYRSLVTNLANYNLQHQAQALCAVYLKFDLPFARRAACVVCYADVIQLWS